MFTLNDTPRMIVFIVLKIIILVLKLENIYSKENKQ